MHINTKNAGILIADSCFYGVNPFGMSETSKLKEYESKIVILTIMFFKKGSKYIVQKETNAPQYLRSVCFENY